MVNTLIVGMGRMGERHLKNAMDKKFKIQAVLEVDSERFEHIKSEYNLVETQSLRNLSEIKYLKDIELVIIATNADSHLEYAMECLKLDGLRHILCEKPMAQSIGDCLEMISVAEERGVNLSVNHQMRFMEQYRIPKQICNSPAFGGLVSMSINAGNFGLAMNGTHYFEAFSFMTDSEIATISATLSDDVVRNPRGDQYSDVGGVVVAETTSGQTLILNCIPSQGHGVTVTYQCMTGWLLVDELTGEITTQRRKSEFRSEPATRYGLPSIQENLTVAPADALKPSASVLSALIDNQEFPDGYCGLETVKAVHASHVSSQNGGRKVNLRDLSQECKLPIA